MNGLSLEVLQAHAVEHADLAAILADDLFVDQAADDAREGLWLNRQMTGNQLLGHCRMVVQSQPLPFLRAAALNCSVVIAVAGLPSNVLFLPS